MMIDFDYLFNKYDIKPDSILHLGSNTGQEAETYKRLGVKKVIWIEAIESVYNDLEKHLQAVDCMKDATCINACVGEIQDKEVEFNISNNEAQSSSYLELGHHKIIHPSVEYIDKFKTKITRIDNLFSSDFFKEGTWLLNADLQGSELEAFKGMGQMLNDFEWVYSEVNFKECYLGGALVYDVDNYLKNYNFNRVETGEIVGETWTDALYTKG